ncbi:BMP family ABC transporter substrate-binding protein [Methylobacterium oryzae]|uniref:BMP family ABC transporter substrate-binding protein n=1 Tax=Methylobacterium oryzae TaxID=334852 RepID=A0ABU7TU90_9HYPH
MRSKLILAAAALHLAAAPALSDPLKVGLLIPNAIAEVGWDHEIDRGGKALVQTFGDKIQLNSVTGVLEGPDATRVMNKMAADGSRMVILGGFGQMNDGLRLARKDPKLSLLHLGGYMNEPNFATLAIRHYEGSYLCGMAAGFATKSKQLGIVAAFPLPEVLNILNAWVLGAQSVNPELKPVKVVWLNSWFDPTKEKSAAESLVTQGSDVVYSLFPGTASTVSTAEQLGVYVTVTMSDASKFAPKKHLCAAQADFAPGFVRKVQQVLDGKFQGDDTFLGVKDASMAVAGLNKDLGEDHKKAILARQEEIRTGGFQPFQGPIMANDGSQAVAAGAALSDKEIKGMNFLVKGVDAKIPARK